MINGTAIAKQLSRLRRKYDPDEVAGGRLPVTMRELVEGKFAGECGNGGGSVNFDIFGDCQSGIDYSLQPVTAAQIAVINRPAAPVAVTDWLGFYPLFSAFWQWLKREKKHCEVNIDHVLVGDFSKWPIYLRFEKELLKRGNCGVNDIFNTDIYIDEPDDGIWGEAYMPLYDYNSFDDDVPLFEFLDSFARCEFDNISFPAVVREMRAETAAEAELIIANIVKAKRTNLLTAMWQTAIEGCIEAGCPIGFSDWQECRVEIEAKKARSIDLLFSSCKTTSLMRKSTAPLVRKCLNNPERLWSGFVDQLCRIGREHPELKIIKEGIKVNV